MSTMGATNQVERRYLPAAGRDLFLPFYDLITKILGADRARLTLLDQPQLQSAKRVLDIGSGTGTFAVLLKQRFPGIEVIGLDPDSKALARAQKKAARANVAVQFDQGFADQLPYQSGSIDAVFSSFMFHHLEGRDRENMLREVRRVLRPGGSLSLMDFEAHGTGSKHGLMRMFHSGERLRDNSEARILELMKAAGFSASKKIASLPVLLGLGRAGSYQATS